MSCDKDKIETLKLKLRTVTKNRISKEKEVMKLRNKERSLSDELNALKAEVDYLSEQLEMLKKQLIQSKHQISMIEICSTSEDVKIGAHTAILNEHLGGFQELFNKEQREIELRISEQRHQEEEQMQLLRQKEFLIAEEKAKQERETATIEEECEVIERECGVLKKRNHAILLKLRKKMLEAENLRRERAKKNLQNKSTAHSNN